MIPQTEDLPGVEGEGVSGKKLKSVDEALAKLLNAREKRRDWGEKEAEAQATLVALFHKHEIKVYYFGDTDRRYALTGGKEKIKVLPEDADNGEPEATVE